MLGIAVHLLGGRYAATEYNDRDRAEWPPHPARLFSALVDAWAAGGQDPDEARALRWLEGQPAPAIAASEAGFRAAPTVFVPVNDPILVGSHADQAKVEAARQAMLDEDTARARTVYEKQLQRLRTKAHDVGNGDAKALLPEGRPRQPRTFPVALPDEPTVVFAWTDAPDGPTWDALDGLAARVARLGHSSSFVSCRVVDEAPAPAWEPDDDGDTVLRVPWSGQLDRLMEAYERHHGVEARVLPDRKQRYARVGAPARPVAMPHLSGEWLVFERTSGPRLPLVRGVDIAVALRGAVLSHSDEPVPEAISGHRADGSPIDRPHVAFVPLPFVHHAHATGHLLGVALVLPRALGAPERDALLVALGRWRRASEAHGVPPGEVRLTLGRSGVWTARLLPAPEAWGLRPSTWCRASRTWVSVTPVALDSNPGNLRSRDAEVASRAWESARGAVSAACPRAGLPEPAAVAVSFAPLTTGSAPADRFPPFPRSKRPGRFRRVLVHAALQFDEPVQGPLLLGAGRYLGLGLFRPLDEVAR